MAGMVITASMITLTNASPLVAYRTSGPANTSLASDLVRSRTVPTEDMKNCRKSGSCWSSSQCCSGFQCLSMHPIPMRICVKT